MRLLDRQLGAAALNTLMSRHSPKSGASRRYRWPVA